MSLLLIKGDFFLLCRKVSFPWFEALELDGSDRTEQIYIVVVLVWLGCMLVVYYCRILGA